MHEDFQSPTCDEALDAAGVRVDAFDLVRISHVDAEYLGMSSDPEDIAFYTRFGGAVAMVVYGDSSPDGKFRWYSPGNRNFYVLALLISDDAFCAFDIVIPSKYVTRMERNPYIYAAFGVLGGRRNWIDRSDYGAGDQSCFSYLESLLRTAESLP